MLNPMLCQKIDEEEFNKLDLQQYLAQRKEDGELLFAIKKNGELFLINRANREKSNFFVEIVDTLKKIDFDFMVVGEITTSDGIFNSFQHRGNKKNPRKEDLEKYPLVYNLFDIIQLREENLCNVPLIERIKHLERFKGIDRLNILEFKQGEEIKELYERAKLENWEGLVLKPINSSYIFGDRSVWKKLKLFLETTILAVSYTINNKGIRIETKDKVACQISGEQHKEVKKILDEKGECEINIQYLGDKTPNGFYRFISYRGLK